MFVATPKGSDTFANHIRNKTVTISTNHRLNQPILYSISTQGSLGRINHAAPASLQPESIALMDKTSESQPWVPDPDIPT